MAGTVKIPGVGTVPTKYAVAGGLAVAAVAGIAWVRYANARQAVDEEAPAVADSTGEPGAETIYPAYATDYAADESYSGGGYPYPSYTTPSYGLTTTTQTANPTTNSEWTQRSIEHLENIGVDSREASLSVSRYLLKECVTTTQADIVRQAVAAIGTPPQGTFSILVCPAGSPGDGTKPPTGGQSPALGPWPGKPRVTSVGRTTASIDWPHVPGADGYTVYKNGSRVVSVKYSGVNLANMRPNTSYRIRIEPIPAKGFRAGPSATLTVKTKK